MASFAVVVCAVGSMGTVRGNVSPSPMPNMNGGYPLSQTPGAHDTQAKFPKSYIDYPGGVSSFDVYSPLISHLYSQVFWKGLDPVPLPEAVVKRFDRQGMAVVGFEVDQVRRTPQGDVSVPISVVYNHHFESTIVGKHGSFKKVGPDDPRIAGHHMGHGVPSDGVWIVEDRGTATLGIPTQQGFGAANGGEFRKSFHGYAPGFAQVVDSPTHIQITPMQIDTWHREKMNLTSPTKFVPGPLPRNSEAPPDALYSGLLECPVTTRIRKEIESSYVTQNRGSCAAPIQTAAECFAATNSTFRRGGTLTFNFSSLSTTSLPRGCSATSSAADARSVHVYFNEAQAGADCAAGASRFAGAVQSLVHTAIEIDVVADTVTIMLVGPSGVWFGVGFNATVMADRPWALIVDGEGHVSERRLVDHDRGSELPQSVTVLSSTSSAGRRSVVLRQRIKGAHFSFSPSGAALLPLINAVGSGPTLSYHKEKGPTAVTLLPVSAKGVAGTCLCGSGAVPFGQAKGSLVYARTAQAADTGSGRIGFNNHCAPQPRSDLLAMRNPTCDLRSYVGGQIACHHMFSLLDADQEIPWVDQPLEYHMKFRFWVQEYNASYHTDVKRTTWGIASPVEYDVPKCAAGVLGCSQQQDGRGWVHTITGTFEGAGRLVAAHFHCHAPTCLSIAMYRCAKGTKVCNASNGQLLCHQEPIYGGTGRVDDSRFDEPGYILQPPCLWGSGQFGLEEPPDVTGYVLGSVKTANATSGHHGEMAWQQMFYVDDPNTVSRLGVYV